MENFIKQIKSEFTLSYIDKLFSSTQKLNVLIIGDTIIDEYTFVASKGRAVKDPILSTEFKHNEKYAGGILAIANHVSSFVNSITVLTLLGDKEPQLEYVSNSLNKNITLRYFVKENAPTTVKKRYIDAYRNHKLFKVEYINDTPITEKLTEEITTFLKEEASKYDLVLVADFGHGFLNAKIRREIEDKARFLALNVQSNSSNMGYNLFNQYQRADFITMNDDEMRLPFSKRFEEPSSIIKEIQEKLQFNNILLTQGKKGCIYFQNAEVYPAPTLTTSVKDTVGAGDALFSIAALCVFIKAEPELVPFIANVAGGIASNIMGNKESVTRERISTFIADLYKTDIKQYLRAVNETLSKVNVDTIDAFVGLLLEAYNHERNIYIFGNGGSSATASHFCGDMVKGLSYGMEKRFRAICLNDNLPVLMAIANDSSYDDIFIEQLKNFLRKDDLVIGISGSGNSTNVVKALEYANHIGAKSVAICGFKGGKIKDLAHLAIHAEINDMEVSEDIHHLILAHCVKRIISQELKNTNMGETYMKRIV